MFCRLILKLSGKSTVTGRDSGEFLSYYLEHPRGSFDGEANLSGFRDRENSYRLLSMSFFSFYKHGGIYYE